MTDAAPNDPNQQVRDNDEEKRALSADFAQVFGTPQGQRVLSHIMRNLCFVGADFHHPANHHMPITGERSVYLHGRQDVGNAISRIINATFVSEKPVVRHRPPQSSKFSSIRREA